MKKPEIQYLGREAMNSEVVAFSNEAAAATWQMANDNRGGPPRAIWKIQTLTLGPELHGRRIPARYVLEPTVEDAEEVDPR